MKIGKIYKSRISNNLFMFSGNTNATYFLGGGNKWFGKNGGNFSILGSESNLASKEETNWLLACIRQDKYIPFSQIKFKNKVIQIY